MTSTHVALLLAGVTYVHVAGIITRWTNPKIKGPNGKGTLVPHVLEGHAGRTNIYVNASVARAQYFLVYQRTDGLFAINEITGELTITPGVAELDTETDGDTYIMVIWAKGDDFSVGTATATVLVEDLNDNAPTFAREHYQVVVKEGLAQGSVVTIVTAADIDTTVPNNELMYSITDIEEEKTFTIDPLSGLITVRPGKTVTMATSPHYNLTVWAVDQGRPQQTGSTKLTVLVGMATRRVVTYVSVILPMLSLVM